MISRLLGRTGMFVSALGLGAGPLGDEGLDDDSADRLIRGAIDLGIRVIDTAPSYGASEARIARVLGDLSAPLRDSLVIVTKGGYGVPGVADWTPEVIDRGVDDALARLSTDRIDVFLLHSCPRERLERGDLLPPLERARASGKVRAVGYSGDGDALAWAARCEAFDVVECSVNLVDQEALASSIPTAAARGAGVLAKRSIAGAPWARASSEYRERWDIAFSADASADIDGLGWNEVAVRFAAFAPGVGSALVGTRSADTFRSTAAIVERGPLPARMVEELRARFAAHGACWHGVV